MAETGDEPVEPERHAVEPDRDAAGRQRRIPVWVIPLMIGIVTVTAGVFAWRAGQLGSSAAFQDRQAVGQTIKQQQVAVEARLGSIDAAVAYVRYRADFAEAAALDDAAAEVTEMGLDGLAAELDGDAQNLRTSASQIALAAGVFGRQTLLNQTVTSSETPIDFDIDERVRQLEVQLTTGVGAVGVLDPDRWAADADDTRSRVRGLRLAALLLLVSAIAFTVAQLTERRPTRWAGAAVGSVVFVAVGATTLATVF